MVPKFDGCNNFGHTRENCARTYATALMGATVVSALEYVMDEVDAEAAISKTEEEVKSPSEQAPLLERAREGSDGLKRTGDATKSDSSTAAGAGLGLPAARVTRRRRLRRSLRRPGLCLRRRWGRLSLGRHRP